MVIKFNVKSVTENDWLDQRFQMEMIWDLELASLFSFLALTLISQQILGKIVSVEETIHLFDILIDYLFKNIIL